MNTLFIRIYLLSLIFIFAIFFFIMFIANILFYHPFLEQEANDTFKTISLALNKKHQQDWQEEIKIYDELSENVLSLITEEQLSEIEHQQYVQNKNNIIIPANRLGEVDTYVLFPLPNSPWLLKVSEGDGEEMSIDDWLDIIIVFLIIFFALTFGLFLLIRAITQPVKDLTFATQKIAQGDLTARVTSNLPSPLNTLASSFNIMAERLNTSLREQQVLIGAIPHELRAPLGKIRFALDITRSRKTVEALRQDIEKIDGYADEMQVAVDEILELNRLQNHTKTEQTPFDLCQHLHLLEEQFNNENTNLILTLECQKITTKANTALLKRALSNLLNNAQHYAKTTIHIKAWQDDSATVIQVDDDGGGIDNDKFNDVFIPFSTLDSSRNRKTGGIGLGLAIVKMIMEKHQGHVTVERSDLGGARFTLHW